MARRDEIQAVMTEHIHEARKTILLVSMRVGKTKIALDAIDDDESVLVVYPLTEIKKGWVADIKKFPPKSKNITFSTIHSLHKLVTAGKTFRYVIVDEPQLCTSPKQLASLKYFRESADKFVGLTGTLSSETERQLWKELNWKIGITYTVADAIRDGLVKDYRIFVHFTKLDQIEPYVHVQRYGRTIVMSEARAYNAYTDTMNYFKERMDGAEGRTYIQNKMGFQKYMGLRTNLLYNSVGLFKYANLLVNAYSDRKALIYARRTEIADRLSTKSFHSKNRDAEALEWFKESEDGHLGAVNSVSAGVTIKNLSTVIFHSYDSNTETLYQKLARSLMYEFKGDVSDIHIVCLQDTNMEDWVSEACSSLEQDKIHYVFGDMVIPKIEYLKDKYASKQLYFYKGKLVYRNGTDRLTGADQFSFINSPDKAYSMSYKNLVEL